MVPTNPFDGLVCIIFVENPIRIRILSFFINFAKIYLFEKIGKNCTLLMKLMENSHY